MSRVGIRLASMCAAAGMSVFLGACGASSDPAEAAGSVSEALNPGLCSQSEPKDVLIAGLVKDSWIAAYPLTRLTVAADGSITGANLPDLVAGDLEVINTIAEARESVAAAVAAISGLPDYGIAGMGEESASCDAVSAWTPTGVASVSTTEAEYFTGGVNDDSWRKTHKAFGKQCPLVKRLANRDVVDPPGDGSTSLPPSTTVSTTGVIANAFGYCPAGTPVGTYCKLSYSTGLNWSGRTCQYYYGSLRCLLY